MLYIQTFNQFHFVAHLLIETLSNDTYPVSTIAAGIVASLQLPIISAVDLSSGDFVVCHNHVNNNQGDHSPETLKFPDISLTMCGTHAHVKWYS